MGYSPFNSSERHLILVAPALEALTAILLRKTGYGQQLPSGDGSVGTDQQPGANAPGFFLLKFTYMAGALLEPPKVRL